MRALANFEESDPKDVDLDIKTCVYKSDCLAMFSLRTWLSIQREHTLSPPLRQAGSRHQICFVAMSSSVCCAITNTCRNSRRFCCSCAWQPQFSLFVLYSPPVLGHRNSSQSCWWVCFIPDVLLVLPSSVLAVPGKLRLWALLAGREVAAH